MTIIETSENSIDLSGIDDHTIRNLKIVKAGGVTKSSHGDIIIVIEQAAHMPDGKTIISCGQLEHFKIQVEEKSKTITGKTPCITTLEGYKIPMATRRGLPYISLRTFTEEEGRTLPRVTLTSPMTWDPSVLDGKVDEDWYQKTNEESAYAKEMPFDAEGNLKKTPEDDDSSDHDDRESKELSREDIRVFYASMVQDELQHSFHVCNIEGILHDMRHDDEWDDNGTSSDESSTGTEPPDMMQRAESDDDSSDDEEYQARVAR